MSRATDLAKLPRNEVISVWHATFPSHLVVLTRWLSVDATKEQLVSQIVTEEERCQSQP